MAYGTTNCSGTLGGTHDDVIVTGGSCTLDDATVRGSVKVSNGGTLTATGGTEVRGSIQVNFGGNIDLDNVIVLGNVSLKDSGDVTVGAMSTIGALKLERSGAITASGAIASVESKDSAGIKLDGATVFPGGVTVERAAGDLKICGSTIEGVVNVVSTTGVLVQSSCGASTIDGSVSVQKGTGDVRLVGAELTAGDLIVIEQTGNVLVDGTSLSDLKLEKITGSVTLTDLTTDSDVTIVQVGDLAMQDLAISMSILPGDLEIKFAGKVTLDKVTLDGDSSISGSGDVDVMSSDFRGDMKITSNRGVTITSNDFFLEDVLISNNSGPVVGGGNVDFSMSIIENNAVTVTGNTFTDAEVSKNTGGVSIVGNTGAKLICADNNPAPTGSGNTINELAGGQCAGF